MAKRIYAHKTFPPASDSEIAAAEEKYGVSFQEDYRAFLKTDNGLIIKEEDHDNETDGEEWINEATRIFGLNDDPHYKFGDGLNSVLDPRFLKIFYSVGIDAGGNDLVQIAAGKRCGELAMLDHEVYSGMEELLEVEGFEYPSHDEGQKKLPFKTFDDATPDQILDECFTQGYLAHYPITFGKQIKALDKIYNEIAQSNKIRPKEIVKPRATISALRLYLYENEKPYAVEKLEGLYGTVATIQPDEGVGWILKVKLEEDREIRVETTVTVDGSIVADQTISTIETNTKCRTVLPMTKDGKPLPSGKYEIKIAFPDDQALDPVTSSFQIFVKERQPGGTTCLAFEAATDAEITRIENKLPYTFCEDFRQFLASENGRHFFWPWIKLWKKVAKNRRKDRNREASSLTDRGGWELGVTEIYGLQKPWIMTNKDLDPPTQLSIERGLIVKIKPNGTWKQINPVLCPVADDMSVPLGGWYQIVAGKHRGKMARCKESVFDLDRIFQIKDYKRVVGGGKKAKTRSYPFENVAKATPDQIIDAYLADDFIEIIDMDFRSFRDLVVSRHEKEFAKMRDKYIDLGSRSRSIIGKTRQFLSGFNGLFR